MTKRNVKLNLSIAMELSCWQILGCIFMVIILLKMIAYSFKVIIQLWKDEK